MNKEWIVYQKCLIPNIPSHKCPRSIPSKWSLLKQGVLMARWTDQWDCEQETEWYFCIKDNEFDISALKSNYRYKITKGSKNFDVRFFNPEKYITEINEIFNSASATYSKVNQPTVLTNNKSRNFSLNLCNREEHKFLGAFERSSGTLCGFIICQEYDEYTELQSQKVFPSKEHLQVNAALVRYFCEYYLNNIHKNYVNDGSKNIRHITHFQEYLVKYFGFRKAYCRLNIVYNPIVEIAIIVLYPFRNLLQKIAMKNDNKFIYDISCVLKQECIRRSFQ